MAHRFKMLQNHLQSRGVYIALLMLEWLICLFINNAAEQTEVFILDLFYLGGINELLRVVLTVIALMEPELLELDDMVKITMTIQSFGLKVTKNQLAARMVGISNDDIDRLRTRIRINTIATNQQKFVSA